jgi:hypothetical protein
LLPQPAQVNLHLLPSSVILPVGFGNTLQLVFLFSKTQLVESFFFEDRQQTTHNGTTCTTTHALTQTHLLDGVAVGRSLGGVDEFISETLRSGLDVAESG